MYKKLFSLLFLLVGFNQISISQKNLSNELIWYSREFSSEYVYSVRSMNDGEHFSTLESNKIQKYSYKDFSKSIATIFDGKDFVFNGKNLEIEDYFFNADESQVLIATNITPIYRRSFTANYYIVDLKTKKITQLSDKGSQQLADFSPDGKKVAYVMENNLYYLELSTGKTTAITSDGATNKIINGTTDWVYEEEFEITKGFYWSPDNNKIAYYRFDESQVKDFTMEYFNGETYPNPYTFKYPKAGEDNSRLSVHIYYLDKNEQKPFMKNGGNHEYFPRMQWTLNNQLCVLAMNRHQSVLDYILIDENAPASGSRASSQKVIYTDQSKTYVEVDNNLIFLKDGKSFLRTSEKDGFNHIYLIGFDGSEKQITKGNWDVIDLKGINEESGTIYYTSVEEGAIYSTLYSIDIKGDKKTKLSEKKGNNDAEFSTGMKYYVNYYSNANLPYYITVHNAKGKEITVLKDNQKLITTLKKYELAKKEFITIKGIEHDLNASIIKPTNFDASKKYPVFFNIYNGPGSNTVKDSWAGSNFLFHQLLVQNGYIVINVDTRGTLYRGADFKKSTYLQLGKLETEDMIAVAKEVGKWTYVDKNRIGVQGWSYGGYMASLCMTKGAEYFKMGIAVAPVTNWRWYDNIYTERFMRTPQENASGYDDNSPINHAAKIKGKYLLIHGSGDDNVHAQNAMEMTRVLVDENIPFDMFIYPNKNHGIYGGKTRLHLFNKILNYTLENL